MEIEACAADVDLDTHSVLPTRVPLGRGSRSRIDVHKQTSSAPSENTDTYAFFGNALQRFNDFAKINKRTNDTADDIEDVGQSTSSFNASIESNATKEPEYTGHIGWINEARSLQSNKKVNVFGTQILKCHSRRPVYVGLQQSSPNNWVSQNKPFLAKRPNPFQRSRSLTKQQTLPTGTGINALSVNTGYTSSNYGGGMWGKPY